MRHKIHLLALPLCAILTAVPAAAGSPDNPGNKGDLVEISREARQSLGGPSGWGQQVSGKATGAIEDPINRNLGDYLNNEDPGPNPANDQGAGND